MTDATPSPYEQNAWQEILDYKGRPISKVAQETREKVGEGIRKAGDALGKVPGTKRVGRVAAKAGTAVAKGAKKAADAVPDGVTNWVTAAGGSIRTTGQRLSRIGLTPKAVVKRHKKRGRQLNHLYEIRALDLEEVDEVAHRRWARWAYPTLAAAGGAAAGLVITGGQVTVGSGVGAAPGAGAVAGAFAGDMAAVLGLSSRVVGLTALQYGYDPELPSEKLFVLAVVNLGTAASASAKTAAMADVSRLTQALVRSKTWAELSNSAMTRIYQQFVKMMGLRGTRQGLAKFLPVANVIIGSTMNWATLEGVVDAADVAYRRRFLLEKYPHLADSGSTTLFDDVVQEEDDHTFSVLDEVEEVLKDEQTD